MQNKFCELQNSKDGRVACGYAFMQIRYASGYAATQMREIRRYCDGIIGEAAGGGILGSGETLYKM